MSEWELYREAANSEVESDVAILEGPVPALVLYS
jgi:hypothetical protein